MKTIKLKTVSVDGVDYQVKTDHPGSVLGWGDVIKKITDKLGIKQCPGCKKRQGYLNRFKFKV
jgi:hypothetical protein